MEGVVGDEKYFRCEDGVCRPGVFNEETQEYETACLSYIGCGLDAAYQCPGGQCVSTPADCLAYSTVCADKTETPY